MRGHLHSFSIILSLSQKQLEKPEKITCMNYASFLKLTYKENPKKTAAKENMSVLFAQPRSKNLRKDK
ncbi:hypothetical protein OSO01_34490 [Oceanobacillus sojae]|uniref:Uncharacterized protein n=1 Tax=Oceanobacillus sojae TaxID=582851 RepID=A0A511ZMP3_9BACI|nr:hypothetical protein OSO01_34490 [Oceanobacillus sojae]